jgi:hypothetical protein
MRLPRLTSCPPCGELVRVDGFAAAVYPSHLRGHSSCLLAVWRAQL